MKKTLLVFTLLFTVVLVACGKSYKVEYNYNNDQETKTKTVKDGNFITSARPSKQGHLFGGWYTDIDDLSTYFALDKPVTSDLVLYAKWYPIIEETTLQVGEISTLILSNNIRFSGLVTNEDAKEHIQEVAYQVASIIYKRYFGLVKDNLYTLTIQLTAEESSETPTFGSITFNINLETPGLSLKENLLITS